jgi:endo-1,4-beta-xylanase
MGSQNLKAQWVGLVTLSVILLLAACSASSSKAAPPACVRPPTGCSLAAIGRRVHVTIGAAVPAGPIDQSGIERSLLVTQFDSVTPEYQATWTQLEPHQGHVDYGPLDDLVRFAGGHHLAVRGHVLLWDQDHDLPAWVAAIDDPVRLRQVIDRHITDVVHRYRGRIGRWDVVNEPLQTSGPDLHHGHLLAVLGPGYIADAFRAAHAADPTVSLWLNESNTEVSPSKADALVALAGQLKQAGVPISGVGLETHLLSGHAPSPGVIGALIGRLRALGLQVAVTELDVPVAGSGSTAQQVAAYRQVAAECRSAGCSEITTWGIDDSHTWLDAHLHRRHTDPLLFSAAGAKKSAYYAFRQALWGRAQR